MTWRVVVFDWDGTLADSTGHIVELAQAAIAQLGLPSRTDAQIRATIGLGFDECWAQLYPEHGAPDMTRFVQRYRAGFSNSPDRVRLFPGVRELLADLRAQGYTLAVATGKGRAGLEADLERFRLGGFFATTRCGDETRSKPHPAMLLQIMERLGTPATATLMVGDTDFDLRMAHSAGAGAVAVASGAHDTQRLAAAGPLACLQTVAELSDWLPGSRARPGA